MKFTKYALTLTTAMALSCTVYANNTIQTSVDVTAYVAAGLSITEKSPLVFGAVVAPTGEPGTISPTSVSVNCLGEVSYPSLRSSPAGQTKGANTNAGESDTPQRGLVTIAGEKNYAVSVNVVSGPVSPTDGVVFKPKIKPSDDCEGDDLVDGDTQLVNGKLQLSLFGDLEITKPAAGQNVKTTAVITINYR